tara:strand:- start:681 stop:1742 length:1062 start_codon:yes stop_codon:yes gene_type:complete
MALTDPLGSNILIGGVGGSSTLGANADTIGDQFVPEVWGQAVLDSFNKNTVMAKLGTDLSAIAQAQGGDKINLPHVGTPIVKPVTQNAEVITLDVSGSDTATSTTLTIDQHHVAPIWIPDAVKAQATYDLFSLYASQMGYAIARAIDNYVAYSIVSNLESVLGSGDGITSTTAAVEVGTSFTEANLASLMGLIVGETGDTNGWTLVLSPVTYGALANLGGSSFDQGTANAPLGADFARTGAVGTLLGMPVVMSNNAYMDVASVSANAETGTTAWTGFDTGSSGGDTADDDHLMGFAIHKDALYFAMQKSTVQQSYQHTYMQDLVSADALYGCAVRNADSAGDRKIIALYDSLD